MLKPFSDELVMFSDFEFRTSAVCLFCLANKKMESLLKVSKIEVPRDFRIQSPVSVTHLGNTVRVYRLLFAEFSFCDSLTRY